MALVSRAMLCAAAIAGSAQSSAIASPPADHFRGKQVTIQVGFAAGGGYDITTRVVARHLGRFIPGNPAVVVQNVPGAGSMQVANFIFNAAPRDGTVLGVFSASVSLEPLFGNAVAKFDPRKFAWIGSFHRESPSCGVWKEARPDIASLDDLIATKRTVVFGSTGPAAPTTTHPMLLKNMFGANAKVVVGYKGTKDVNLAMQSGEVHATCGMFETAIKGSFAQDVESGRLVIFVHFRPTGTVPIFGKATSMYSRIKSDRDRQIADLIFREADLTRPLAAPPGTPPEVVAALRNALLDTMNDPALIADGKKMETEFNPLSGEDTVKLFEQLYDTPPDIVKQTQDYVRLTD